MSVAGISSVTPFVQGPSNPLGSSRRAEDAAARQMMKDLTSGDLAGAQQAYNTLASFGSNNSGPWGAGSQMQAQFQQLGQDLQNGDLTDAQTVANSMGVQQFQNDRVQAKQAYQSGDMSGVRQAVDNLRSDYWATYGSLTEKLVGPSPSGTGASGLNVQA